jgi:tRNA(Ile)-lysidine synthase
VTTRKTGASTPLTDVRRAVRAVLDERPGRVLVACSGGADSLALAAATAREAKPAGVIAGAVVIDHQLFLDSGRVAARAAAQCRELGLDPVEIIQVDVRDTGEGVEASARNARHAALTEIAGRLGAVAVLLAHTREDQAETVLLRLARGSGARSLAGMPIERGLIVRPLLQLSRSTVRAACAEAGLTAWDDPANGDPRFSRSRVRHDLLPSVVDALGEGAIAGLARSADLLRDDAEALDALAAIVHAAQPAPTELDIALLETQPRAVRTRVIRRACLAAGCPAGSLTLEHVRSLDRLVTHWRGQGPVALPGGASGLRSYGRLEVRSSG